MRKVNWLFVGIMSFVSLLILFGAGMLMGDWRYRAWGMMGPHGMVENWGYSYTPAPLGWVGMIFMSLILSVSWYWQYSASSGLRETSAASSRHLRNVNNR